MPREYNQETFPHAVTFRFETAEEFQAFIIGLVDGWGEPCCQVYWPQGTSAKETKEFFVRPTYNRFDSNEIIDMLGEVDVTVTDMDIDGWNYTQIAAAVDWARSLPGTRPKPAFLP